MKEKNVIAGIHYQIAEGLQYFRSTVCLRLGWSEERYQAFLSDQDGITDAERETIMEVFNNEWRCVFNMLNSYREQRLCGIWLIPMCEEAFDEFCGCKGREK